MANLLTKETRATRKWDYYTRISVLVGFMVSGALALGGILFLPVYVYVRIVANAQREAVITRDDSALGIERQTLTQRLKAEQGIIEQMGKVIDTPSIIDSFKEMQTLIVKNSQHMHVTAFDITYITEEGVYRGDIAGEATSREAVIAVRDIFEQSEYVTSMNFPLTNFTPKEGIYEVAFSVSFKK